MQNYYSKKVIQHFTNPKNFGEIKNADGVGKVGNPACGDVLTLYLKIDQRSKKETIKDIKFNTLGCPAAVAVSDIVCDLVKSKTLKQASKINNQEIVKKLDGLPPIKIHCSLLAEQALKAAIKDYENKKKNNKKQESSCSDERWCGFKCGGCPIEKTGL
jgi:nitrogen fixation NifU-like protein